MTATPALYLVPAFLFSIIFSLGLVLYRRKNNSTQATYRECTAEGMIIGALWPLSVPFAVILVIVYTADKTINKITGEN